MEEASNAKGQRLRLTCTECYRRKIKCDKTIPCGTCVKRGYSDFCTREDEGAVTANNTYLHSDSTAPNDLVRTLLDRVEILEAQLQSNDTCAQMESQPPHSQAQPSSENESHREHIATSVSAPPSPEQGSVGPVQESVASIASNNDDAATVLEFLAWGRNKDAEYGITPQQSSRLLTTQDDDSDTCKTILEGSRDAHLDLLETLLPNQSQVRQLVEYHHTFLLWYHGSYSSTILSQDLSKFLDHCCGDIRHPELDPQWLALLFAILTGCLTCAPPQVRRSWGFQDAESMTLASKWYESTITCLNIGRYIERHTIHSIEAIATLTIAAHILGRSNSQSILLSSAGRIAQSIGLHRLGKETDPVPVDQLRQREAGRRVFNQLCTQDWFQIPFSESYTLNPRFIKTEKPLNCNDDDMIVQPQSVPTQASYCNYRYDIAALMPHLLDATSDCNTLFTKYEQVLKYDDQMRKLATASMPTFLFTGSPVSTAWPVWIGWARRSLAICAAHKIIMIHRSFLGLSFTNSAFSFTRRTCVAAANTILKEALSANDHNGPVLWIEQAFSVAAGIVLSLDIAHRNPHQHDLQDHALLMRNTIDYLKSFKCSRMASRGAQLLSALQQELHQGALRGLGKRQRTAEDPRSIRATKRTHNSNVQRSSREVSHTLQSQPIPNDPTHATTGYVSSPGDNAWDTSSMQFHIDTTLGAQGLFDDLLSFQF